MKKLLFLILFLPVFSFAQSDATNKQEIDSLLTNSAKKNNARYFNRILTNINSSKLNKDSSVLRLTTTGTSGPSTYSSGILNIPQYTSSFPSNTLGVLLNNGIGNLSWATDISRLNTAWATITPTSPWTTQNRQLSYMLDALGFVHLRGQLWTNGTSLTSFTLTIGTLPLGFRPLLDSSFPIEYYDGTNRRTNTINISASTGDITIANGYSSPASDFYFEHVSFSKF